MGNFFSSDDVSKKKNYDSQLIKKNNNLIKSNNANINSSYINNPNRNNSNRNNQNNLNRNQSSLKKKISNNQISKNQIIELNKYIYSLCVLSRLAYEPPSLFLNILSNIIRNNDDFFNFNENITIDNIKNKSIDINNYFNSFDNIYGNKSNKITNNSQSYLKIGVNKKLYNPNLIKNSEIIIENNTKICYIATSDDLNCYVIKESNKLILIFRGTKSLKNAMTDLNIFKETICTNNDLNVHEKVFKGVFKLENEVLNNIIFIMNYLAEQDNEIKDIYVSGHSLGGALATLFSYFYIGIINKINDDLKYLNKNVTCITYGSPRLFNKYMDNIFSQYIDEGRIIFKRIITKGDPITMLPPKSFYFVHAGSNSKENTTFYLKSAGVKPINYNIPLDIKITYNLSNSVKSYLKIKEKSGGFIKKMGLNILSKVGHPHSNYFYIDFSDVLKRFSLNSDIISKKINNSITIKIILYSINNNNINIISNSFFDKNIKNISKYDIFKIKIFNKLNDKSLFDNCNIMELSPKNLDKYNIGSIDNELTDIDNNSLINFYKISC